MLGERRRGQGKKRGQATFSHDCPTARIRVRKSSLSPFLKMACHRRTARSGGRSRGLRFPAPRGWPLLLYRTDAGSGRDRCKCDPAVVRRYQRRSCPGWSVPSTARATRPHLRAQGRPLRAPPCWVLPGLRLPRCRGSGGNPWADPSPPGPRGPQNPCAKANCETWQLRSEEHTSELQSLAYLVCRLLLEKKKQSSRGPTRPPGEGACQLTWSFQLHCHVPQLRSE